MREIDNFSFTVVVPAAGLGKRMGHPKLPKALVLFRKRELFIWSISSFLEFAESVIAVIRQEQLAIFLEFFRKNSFQSFRHAFQNNSSGTAEAVHIGLKHVNTEWSLVVWGDHIGASRMPCLKLLKHIDNSSADFILPLVRRSRPYVYFTQNKDNGTITFHETKNGAKVVSMGISDCGVFLFRTGVVARFLERYFEAKEDPGLTEINFLSLFGEMQKSGITFKKVFLKDELLTFGANSLDELSAFELALDSEDRRER
jgi:bifunctional N-acetylglucosamine-1-phosphate-uridyltransferase/glucosamine-1-phosphate-acetyltransferase GlmU-like protein